MGRTSIIICDDHSLFRQGVKTILEAENVAEIVAEAENGQHLLEILETKEADVILMDIEMPVMNGIVATKKVMEQYPNQKILVLSMFGEENFYIEMINAGAKGFILKTSGIHELEKGIKAVTEGESYFSNELLRTIISNIGKNKEIINSKTGEVIEFNDREMEILQLICQGLSTNEIAEKIALSSKTVEGYRSKLFTKTNSKNAVSLVMFAVKNKLIEIQ